MDNSSLEMNIDEIDWTEYHPFVPGGPAKPHREMTRGEARESFEWFMDQRHERIGQLESLLDRNDVQFSNDVSGLMALEEFFVTHVEPSDEEPVDEKTYTKEEFEEFRQWCLDNGKQWDSVSLPDGTIKAAISDREKHPGNYGNHSCEPNVDKDLVALRDIEAGEEITGDYAQFSDRDWSMECNCGAKTCKGVVQGKI